MNMQPSNNQGGFNWNIGGGQNGQGYNPNPQTYPTVFINTPNDIANYIPGQSRFAVPIMSFVQNDREYMYFREIGPDGNLYVTPYKKVTEIPEQQNVQSAQPVQNDNPITDLNNMLQTLSQQVQWLTNEVKSLKYNNNYKAKPKYKKEYRNKTEEVSENE